MDSDDTKRLRDQVDRMEPTPGNLAEGLQAACRLLNEMAGEFHIAQTKFEDLKDQLKVLSKKFDNLEFEFEVDCLKER